jgi:DNA-binding response OmpR family regulator
VVEPNPALGLDLADALDARGYFVAGPFPSAGEALGWLDRFTPDIEFVDFSLTDKQGAELVREIQVRGIPLVGSAPEAAIIEPLMQAGPATWVAQPCLVSDMLTAIVALLC